MENILTESLEDYIEAIYKIIQKKNVARVKEIAKELKVSNSSVTGALRVLAEKKLVHYAPYENITLTPSGEEIASKILEKHDALKAFFVRILNVDSALADECACKLEHALPSEILGKLKSLNEFLNIESMAGSRCLDKFHYYMETGKYTEGCRSCREDYRDQ